MKNKNFFEKHENFIWTSLIIIVMGVFVALRYDYYFDLNDDVLMKDILAGVYTGMPESYNIQMLWPISAFISLLYQMPGNLSWYGIFLCLCHYGCLFLITHRGLQFCKKRRSKMVLVVTIALLMTGLFLEHLVFAQYTVTCTLLAGTAAFLFYTTDQELPVGEYILKNIPAILLVTLAYLIRSEMLLLVLPMICAAGVAKWGSERPIFTKPNFIKYLSIFGGILAGIGLGQMAHMVAYSTPEWKTFTEYFDNRTELYDFQEIPAYEGNEAFYESVGLTESERFLLENYNFGLDEEINEKLLGQIADYAAANRSMEKPFIQNLKESLSEYVYRLTHGSNAVGNDYPWNFVVILGYLSVLVVGTFLKKGQEGMPRPVMEDPNKEVVPYAPGRKEYVSNFLQIGWKLGFLFFVRTVLWMYIIMRDRVPVRISHSLYLMELCILLAMLFMEWKRLYAEKTIVYVALMSSAVYALFAITMLPTAIRYADEYSTKRAVFNQPYQQLYETMQRPENQKNFYFVDVYTSVNYEGNPDVSYSQKMFDHAKNDVANYDIMGGWASKSPLYRKKHAMFSIATMEEALLQQENVFLVTGKEDDLQWIIRYYADQGKEIEAVLVENVADAFTIYDIIPVE